MRWQEVLGGIQVGLSNEEHELVEQIKENNCVKEDTLNIRKKELVKHEMISFLCKVEK